jgi:membrane protein
MSTWEEKIKNTRVMRVLKVWLSQIILPGFHGVSLYDSLTFFIRQIISPRFTVAARAVSFSFLMSLPPFLLFLFTLIPYLPIPTDSLISSLEETIGIITQNEKLQDSVAKLMNNFFLHKKEVLLSFSVFMTLFFSSNGLMGLMTNFDRKLAGFKPQVWYRKRLNAILLTVVFFVVIILSFSLMIFQAWIFEYLGLFSWIIIGKILQYLIIALMLVLTISLIYRYGPNTNSRWPLLTPGSILASGLIILLTVGFFYAVNNLINYNQIYGSVGTLIIFLVWLFTMSQILLIGFELNVSIFVNKELRTADKTIVEINSAV